MHRWIQRENFAFGKFKSFLRAQFPGSFLGLEAGLFCLPFGQSSCPILLCLICLRTLPWGAHIPQSRWIPKWKFLRGVRLIMVWNYPLTFAPKESFFAFVVSPFSQKGREWTPLNYLPNRVLSLFVLAMIITLTPAITITLRCLQETKTGCLPCFCCYFHFGGKTGGWL